MAPAIGENLPNIRPFFLHTNQHFPEFDHAGLTATVVIHKGPNSLKMDAEARQQAQERSLHYRTPIEDAMIQAHLDEAFDQTERHIGDDTPLILVILRFIAFRIEPIPLPLAEVF